MSSDVDARGSDLRLCGMFEPLVSSPGNPGGGMAPHRWLNSSERPVAQRSAAGSEESANVYDRLNGGDNAALRPPRFEGISGRWPRKRFPAPGPNVGSAGRFYACRSLPLTVRTDRVNGRARGRLDGCPVAAGRLGRRGPASGGRNGQTDGELSPPRKMGLSVHAPECIRNYSTHSLLNILRIEGRNTNGCRNLHQLD